MIRACTGLNEARDASTPDPNSLVGIQKLAALNSNVATRHILESSLYIARSLAEALTYRVADILEYAPFKEEFANKIGKYNMKILDDIKDLYIYDFGVFIEITPDEEQKAQLEANIQMALQQQDINLEDAIDIREIKNLKLANQLLKVKRKKKQEHEDQQAMQQQAMQQQSQMQAQQMLAENKMQEIAATTDQKIKIKQAEIAFEIEKMMAEAEQKKALMEQEFQYNQQLRDMEQQGLQKRESEREVAKGERISQAKYGAVLG